jgi:hypothetical protein
MTKSENSDCDGPTFDKLKYHSNDQSLRSLTDDYEIGIIKETILIEV